ncbi:MULTISPECIES: hypothetical protein [Pectobacterium]|uniref:hypothetical protein n=1 Tax=Pectobacterium TaxID=122277 RepID=UPI0004E83669|nr:MULTISPECIES: hypothetical protein [Pectobacterium]KFX25128.1 hypothetical protein KP24_00105 [Pectobacterium atrosepticum]KGA28372.1 hypothetical protein KS43_21640 [Pectobacterium odoriferum]MBN3239859.1 hypothetical protein [Pectobacterium versatile]MCL6393242.1 hypothetical protein [Pectobacterium atrosepticum]UUE37862.1 hypothetical protein L0Y26_08105 [Pectobacterium aroidearum]
MNKGKIGWISLFILVFLIALFIDLGKMKTSTLVDKQDVNHLVISCSCGAHATHSVDKLNCMRVFIIVGE